MDSDEYSYAISVAEKLRDKGLKIELDVRDKSVNKNFQYAEKHSFPYVVIVGSDESKSSEVTLRYRASREGKRMKVDEAATQILSYRSER